MLRYVVALSLALCVALMPLTALAGGNLDLMPDATWAKPLSDDEMSGLRGGAGIGFNIAFTGFVDSLGAVAGNFDFGPEGAFAAPPPDFDFSNGDALINTQIGSFQGFEGILQLQIVPGNFNFVQQNLFIQIVVMDGVAGGNFNEVPSSFVLP